MNDYEKGVKKIDQALAAGKRVNIAMVVRDPVDALINGAFKRAESQRAKFGTGRTVPLEEHEKTHTGAMAAIPKIAEHYKDDPRVRVHVINNSNGPGSAVKASLDWLKSLSYNDLATKLHEARENEYKAGRISDATYRGFGGTGPANDA